jgi:hypothetical protein
VSTEKLIITDICNTKDHCYTDQFYHTCQLHKLDILILFIMSGTGNQFVCVACQSETGSQPLFQTSSQLKQHIRNQHQEQITLIKKDDGQIYTLKCNQETQQFDCICGRYSNAIPSTFRKHASTHIELFFKTVDRQDSNSGDGITISHLPGDISRVDLLAQIGCTYLQEYQALVCRECEYVVQPSQLPTHRREVHKDKQINVHMVDKAIQGIMVKMAHELKDPPPFSPAIPQLKIWKGFTCNILHCHYSCTTEYTIKKHSRKIHQTKTDESVDGVAWKQVPVQTLCMGNGRRYFAVTEVEEGESSESMWTRLVRLESERNEVRRQQAHSSVSDLVTLHQGKADNTPWLARTGWLDKLKGLNLGHVAVLGQNPTEQEEPMLMKILHSTKRQLKKCEKSVKSASILMQRWLNSYNEFTCNPQPFRIVQEGDTFNRYVKSLYKFIISFLKNKLYITIIVLIEIYLF